MNNPIKNQAKDQNIHLTKEDTQIANKHMKRCSISKKKKDAQYYMSLGNCKLNHYTSVRMAAVQNTDNTKCC